MNPNHDEKGRFAAGDSVTVRHPSTGYRPEKGTIIAREKGAGYRVKMHQGVMDTQIVAAHNMSKEQSSAQRLTASSPVASAQTLSAAQQATLASARANQATTVNNGGMYGGGMPTRGAGQSAAAYAKSLRAWSKSQPKR